MDQATLCSRRWDALDVPAWGSAPVASFWLAIEQPGPWGHRALTESHLDPRLGAELGARAKAAGGEAILIRTPGQHVDAPRRRSVYLGAGDAVWRAEVDDVATLLELDLRDWRTSAPAFGFAPADPIVAVCTNGQRDMCCAVRGRDVATGAAATTTGVWESSHLHGHRFAPTALCLPGGLLTAGLDAELVGAQLAAARRGEFAPGLLTPRHYRGLSWLDKPAQAAEAAVRISLGEVAIDAFAVTDDGTGTYVVAHRDGRSFRVEVTPRDLGEQQMSCGKDPTPASAWVAEIVPPRVTPVADPS